MSARAGWTGADSRKWRARIKPTLPQPCTKCRRDVLATDLWDVDHLNPLALGGTTADGVGPAHRYCNRAHGGRLKAQLAASTKRISNDLPNL
jgi:hypothetical protein